MLWLKIDEKKALDYERETFPDPSRYYVKDFPYQKVPPFTPMTVLIPPKIQGPHWPPQSNSQGQEKDEAKGLATDVYTCDLCNTIFSNETDYSKHITDSHT